MNNSVLTIVGVLLLGFILYFFVLRDKLFGSDGSVVDNASTGRSDLKEGFEYPARAPLEMMKNSYSPPKNVMPSGPNPPSQAPPEGDVVVHADPAPQDPFADQQEASNAEPKMTYPERSFRPAPQNTNVTLAYEAGIAGPTVQHTAEAIQKFGIDMIQNGGEIFHGVYANDIAENPNYSAF